MKEDARKSYTEIARLVGLSEGAVRKRFQALIRSGVIRKFTIRTELGGVRAITLIATEPGIETSSVSKEVAGLEGVECVYEITGTYDVAAVLWAPDVEEVNRYVDAIRRIPGVANTNTMIVLRSYE